jgi:hypothetical protein
MMQQTKSQSSDAQPSDHRPRIFIPGREFASAKEYVDFLREAEVVRIYGAGVLI